jgi:hypothetical protein
VQSITDYTFVASAVLDCGCQLVTPAMAGTTDLLCRTNLSHYSNDGLKSMYDATRQVTFQVLKSALADSIVRAAMPRNLVQFGGKRRFGIQKSEKAGRRGRGSGSRIGPAQNAQPARPAVHTAPLRTPASPLFSLHFSRPYPAL